MDNTLKNKCTHLRSMESDQAASWLMDTFPISDIGYGEVFQIMAHRSWRRADQIRLARYYLQRVPFSSSKPYEVFAEFMSLELFLSVLKYFLPMTRDDINLFVYHLNPVLEKRIKTAKDREAVDSFLSELSE